MPTATTFPERLDGGYDGLADRQAKLIRAKTVAFVIALVFGGAFVFLAWRAWSQNRAAKAFAVNAAQGAGE